MTDLLDRRLTEAGRRWRAEQSSPPDVPLDRLDEPLARELPWRRVAAVAVAVVLVGAGATALVRSGRDSSVSPGGSASRTAGQRQEVSQVVPWRPLRPPDRAVRPGVNDPRASYRDVVVTGDISGHHQPGDTLAFTVTLESLRDLTLAPCPVYDIAFGAHAFHTWRLNCPQVPFREAAGGRPFLPAHTKVRFEMRVTVPDVTGRQKVLWTLESGSGPMPGFYGIVRVG